MYDSRCFCTSDAVPVALLLHSSRLLPPSHLITPLPRCPSALLPSRLPSPLPPQDKFIPELAGAFFSMDESRLSVMCRDAAMAQIRAVAAAREVEGLTMGVGAASPVLAVQKTDFVQARKLEAGVPIILVTSLVQYIHCVRNRKVRGRVAWPTPPCRCAAARRMALLSRRCTGSSAFHVFRTPLSLYVPCCRARLLRALNPTSERHISSWL